MVEVRPFAWHDWITLYRNRRRVLCTDSALALTRGGPLGPMAFLSRFDPNHGSFTGVVDSQGGNPAVMGQMTYTPGARSARVAFLLPGDALDAGALAALVETLAVQAGEWGACHLLAEVEETSPAVDPIRRSGLGVYAWQTIWKLPALPAENESRFWRPAVPGDTIAARSLYQFLVPPLVQAAEPFIEIGVQRWVVRQNGDLLAYAEVVTGPNGQYIQPVIHPDAEDPAGLLRDLLARSTLAGRGLYVAARSYQSWLETALARLNGSPAPRQALLVKHLAILQRAGVRHPVLEKIKNEAGVPLVQHTTIYKN